MESDHDLIFLFEHDLWASGSRFVPWKTGSHFSGSRSNWYRVAALWESVAPQRNWRGFAKQHRNNAAGKVFAAKLFRDEGRAQSKGPGDCPDPRSSKRKAQKEVLFN
jgi:hypothetical protein